MRSMLLLAALVVTSLAAAGCEKKITAVCEEKCAGADVQTCQTATEKSEATAEERGCESDFESYASCLDANATCTAGALVADACATQAAALAKCVSGS